MIEDKSIAYNAFCLYIKLFTNSFFKQIIVKGAEKIPWGKPIILAPNHQNALVDPLVFVTWKQFTPVWLARGDIFNKFTTAPLRFLKILPIYRQQDGVSALAKNGDIFELSSRILKKNKVLVVFPEAAHSERRQLLSIKKGIARIVFKTLEETDFELDIQIQPVGVYYEHYSNYKHNVILNFGDPIPAKKYLKEYKESLFKANKAVQNDIEKSLKNLAMHIPSTENYDLYEDIRHTANALLSEKSSLDHDDIYTRFHIEKAVIDKLWSLESSENQNERSIFDNIKSLNDKYRKTLKQEKLRDENIDEEQNASKKKPLALNLLLLLLTLPIFIIGFITHIIPFKLPDYFIKKHVEDKQFFASFNIAISIISFPVNYLFWGIALSQFVSGLTLFAGIAVIVLSGDWAFAWYRFYKKTRALFKAAGLRKKNSPIFAQKEKLLEALRKIF